MSDLETETASNTATFEHFGREWSVPTKQRLSHIRAIRDGYRQGSNLDLLLAEVFLPADQLEALFEIDPTVDELDEFGDALSGAMGLGGSGNSASSSTSS